MFASWAEISAAARGPKDGAPGDPALQILVGLIKDRDRGVLQMCHQLEASVDSPAAARITISTVHKAKGLEWPQVLLSSDFKEFVELEGGKPVVDLQEAYIMCVALTPRPRAIASLSSLYRNHSASLAKARRSRQQPSNGCDSPGSALKRDIANG